MGDSHGIFIVNFSDVMFPQTPLGNGRNISLICMWDLCVCARALEHEHARWLCVNGYVSLYVQYKYECIYAKSA